MIRQHPRMAAMDGTGKMEAQGALGFGLGIFFTRQNRPLSVLAGPTATLSATPLVTESKARAREVRKVLRPFLGVVRMEKWCDTGGMMMAVRRCEGAACG